MVFVLICLGIISLLPKTGLPAAAKNQMTYLVCMGMGLITLVVMLLRAFQILTFKWKIKRDARFVENLWNRWTQRERFETFVSRELMKGKEPKIARRGHMFPLIRADISTCDYCGTRKADQYFEFWYGEEAKTTRPAGLRKQWEITTRTIRGRKKFKLRTDCIVKGGAHGFSRFLPTKMEA
jgi:hypothetical protein